jgi:sialate O-acetylesterase
VAAGPEFKSATVEGGSIRLSFDSVGGGLVAKDGTLKSFAIAGEDKKFVWAEAKIDGETVVVSSPQVAKPVAVRYAWENNPDATLFNKQGLPAAPFRTDDWPGVTDGRK